MEETPSFTSSDPSWDDQFALAIQEERSRIEEFLAAHSERSDQVQNNLDEQIRRLSSELNQRHEELEKRCQEIERLESELHRSRHKLSLEVEEHQAEREVIDELRLRLEDELDQSHNQQRMLADERARTRAQRRRIAREFKAQRATHLKELRRQRAELGQQGEPPNSSSASNDASTIDPKKWEELNAERDRLAEQLDDKETRLVSLVDHLSKTEEQLAHARTSDEQDDYRKRYEMALTDVRELKAKNEELQNQIRSAPQEETLMAASGKGGILDWEAEKQRILAALEAEFNETENEDALQQQMQMEEIVRRTDQVILEKDREIAELKGLLENQSGNLGSMAVGAVALGNIFDKDQIIREERENLRKLQQEWEEKLRQAEIENSIERAKIARERTEMDERVRTFEKTLKTNQPDDTSKKKTAEKEPVRGRWLTRLGLKNGEDK